MSNAWRELLHDAATPSRLIPALVSGLVIGLLMVVVELSFASLIFSGPLAPFASRAAGLTLFGGFVLCLTVALGSDLPASVALPQDAPAAIMAAVAAGIAASLPAAHDFHATCVTVGAAMALSTLATAVLFLAMARFGLGNLIRFMPYPVVGGFLAGIGWLLVQGSYSIMTGTSLTWAELPLLLTAEKALALAPALALALGLLAAMRRWSSVFILPGALLLALGSFALYLTFSGRTLADAGQAGLLLGGMPEDAMLWPVFSLGDLAQVRWDALLPQIPQLLTIPLVSAISVLLIVSGLETSARRDLDLKRELSANALANFLAGVGGSQAGYTTLSLSLLGPKTGADSRLVGISAALLAGMVTFFGASLLGLFPKFILGGMVLFLGLATLLDWVVDARRQVTLPEYGLILAILCAIGWFGFLAGVGVGLVLTTAFFVVKYSRLPVLRQEADLTELSSARQRSVPDRHILREHGRDVRIFRITGYLFFGSASALSQAVAARLKPVTEPVPSHLVLDFAEVDGFDSSAVNCLLRMLQRCAAVNCRVVFSSAPAKLEEQMRRASPQEAGQVCFLPDLDRALERCEDEVLAREQARLETQRDRLFDLAVDDVLNHLEGAERFEALVERLGSCVERMHAPAGTVLHSQGETPQGVWMFVSGQAEEVRQDEEGRAVRLRALGPGSMAGLVAPERGRPAQGSLTALTDCHLTFLSIEALRRLEAEDPAVALAFHSLYAELLEARLAETVGR